MRQYGIVMQEYVPGYIETDNVLLIGKATIATRCEYEFGFNLVLRKQSPSDIYGEWWICKFRNAFNASPQFYFAIDPPEFYNEYNFGRSRVMHNIKMDFSIFKKEDIVDLISAMPHTK